MACTNCNSNPITTGQFNIYSNSNCGTSGCSPTSCLKYDGPALSCSGIETNDDLNTVLAKLDQAACAAIGDFSTFDVACLDDEAAITTLQEFVEGISAYVCTTRDDLDEFINNTFTAYQTTINDRFLAIENPAITCASAGITDVDTLQEVYAKYCATFDDIYANLDLSGVTWNACFTVPTPPETQGEAFDLVQDQICQLKSLIGDGVTLPTFNNVGSCLPTPVTSADTLVATINKIKTRLCQSPTFDIDDLTWGCTTQPVGDTTDLQAAFQAVLDAIDDIKADIPTFDGSQFTVTDVDGGNPCLGKNIEITALSTPTDRYVGVNGSDGSPGYLANKLTAGTGVTFDVITTPGQLIINASGTATDEKVKAESTDPTPGYLDSKIVAGASSNGVTLSVSADTGAHQLVISPIVNMTSLITAIFAAIEDDEDLKNLFCNLAASCPSPCQPPTNIDVTYTDEITTTTTVEP